MRESFDEYGAASRLKVTVAAWRWAVASRLVPATDAGTGRWSRAVDAEAVRAALRGPAAAFWAAERLNEALGDPLPFGRPRVTAAAVGHLVRVGHLACLGGDAGCPDVHPDQVEALARRRDLPALLDRHVPLGPDEAAVRLGVRRVDFDRMVDLGWITPTGAVDIDYKRQGGVTRVPLYSAQDVALLPVIRPEVDWHELRTVAPGRRSPLSALTPTPEGRDTMLMAGIARIAGVGRAAVANWRRRHPDFPAPTGGTATHPEFDRPAAVAWLLAHDKITVPSSIPSATLVLRADSTGKELRCRLDAPWLQLATDATADDQLSGWTSDHDADALAALTADGEGAAIRRLTAPGTQPLTVLGSARLIDRSRRGAGALRVTVPWPGALRGHLAPGQAGGSARHGVPHTAPGPARQTCGGLLPTRPAAPSTGPQRNR
ncbi:MULTISPECIES: hypothetical protein [Streptomyces]|uniref:Uncharacterized protein n=1 Tax=Streptomyces rochei TaxID=1928 RepID=A0ABW7E9I3_STRRO|nr:MULTISPECIES: hypothetical protein [unclassified Streptomyces]QCR52081.1 hypothetical protein C1N79_35720 [Streptomyces sp. SGAir0924]